jgi:hypothetical protein
LLPPAIFSVPANRVGLPGFSSGDGMKPDRRAEIV